MNKRQIIEKIIDDLPTRDMRSEMSRNEWYGWFEEAFDKGFEYAKQVLKETEPKPNEDDFITGINDHLSANGLPSFGTKEFNEMCSHYFGGSQKQNENDNT